MENLYKKDHTNYFDCNRPYVETLDQYLNLIGTLDNDQLFFRGQVNKDWPIASSLSRTIAPSKEYLAKKYESVKEILSEEGAFPSHVRDFVNSYMDKELEHCCQGYSKFRHSLPAFFHEIPQKEYVINSEFSFLALAQHYGLPTRLIDWSFNPLVALFFAIDGASSNENSEGAVYIYTPDEIMTGEELWTGISSICKQQQEGAGKTKIYLENEEFPDDDMQFFIYEHMVKKGKEKSSIVDYFLTRDIPLFNHGDGYYSMFKDVAIVHDFFDRRMMAQRCAFTYQSLVKGAFFGGEKKIKKIVIKNPLKIKKELSKIGVVTSSIYPSLSGLAYEIKDRYFDTQS